MTGDSAELYSFWPPTLTFTDIGNLGTCTNSPTHMTVDRSGTAWVVGNGNLYKASTTAPITCSQVSNWTKQSGFSDFAVSIAQQSNGDTTLYLLSSDGNNSLGQFDVVSGAFTNNGTLMVQGQDGDMTSTGDGTIWYLVDASPHPFYQFNPTMGNVLTTDSVNAPEAKDGNSALAYFGKLFYFFEDKDVYSYDQSSNTVTKLSVTAPLSVTGAGQSTCVPSVTVDAGTPPPQTK